jgi:hypothetical protein
MIPFAFAGYQSLSPLRATPNPARSARPPALQFDTEHEMAAYLGSHGFRRRVKTWSNGAWRAEIGHQSEKFTVVLHFEDGYDRS